jgi:hypothetical protein
MTIPGNTENKESQQVLTPEELVEMEKIKKAREEADKAVEIKEESESSQEDAAPEQESVVEESEETQTPSNSEDPDIPYIPRKEPGIPPGIEIDLDDVMLLSGILIGNVEKVMETSNRKLGHLTTEQLDEQFDAKNPELLRRAMIERVLSENHGQFEYISDALQALNKKHDNVGEVLQPSTNDKVARGSSYKGELKGAAAKRAVFAAVRGIRRLFLYNSGFHIDVRPPSMSDLNQFYSAAQLQSAEFGHMVGANFLTMMDVYLKRELVEFLPSIVTESNLVDWETGTTLAENISIHDYDTILWGLCTLMYRDKELDLPYTCISPECFYKKDAVKIDLNKVRFDNHTILTEEQIAFTMSNDARTAEELKRYRDDLSTTKEPVKCDGLNFGFTFNIPTLSEFVDSGIELLATVVAKASKSTTNKDVQMFSEYMLHLNQMLLPWVKRLHYYNAEGEEQFTTSERDALIESLSMDLHTEDNLTDQLMEYIRDTRVSYFCYTALKCPICGHQPEDGTVDGYTPVDVQSLFFDLTCRRLGIIE